MSRDPEEFERLIERIRSLEERDGRELSAHERMILRDMMEAWKVWSSLGKASKFVIWLLLSLAAAALAWRQLREELMRWFTI